MHHGMYVTRVPRCMPGSLTSDFLWSRWKSGNRFRHFTYLVRGPWRQVFSKRIKPYIHTHLSHKLKPAIFSTQEYHWFVGLQMKIDYNLSDGPFIYENDVKYTLRVWPSKYDRLFITSIIWLRRVWIFGILLAWYYESYQRPCVVILFHRSTVFDHASNVGLMLCFF